MPEIYVIAALATNLKKGLSQEHEMSRKLIGQRVMTL